MGSATFTDLGLIEAKMCRTHMRPLNPFHQFGFSSAEPQILLPSFVAVMRFVRTWI